MTAMNDAWLHRQEEVDPVPVLHPVVVRRRPAALHPLAAEQEGPLAARHRRHHGVVEVRQVLEPVAPPHPAGDRAPFLVLDDGGHEQRLTRWRHVHCSILLSSSPDVVASAAATAARFCSRRALITVPIYSKVWPSCAARFYEDSACNQFSFLFF